MRRVDSFEKTLTLGNIEDTQSIMVHGGPIAGDLMGRGGMAGWPDLEPGIPRLVLGTAWPTLIQFTGTRIQGTIQIG